MEIRVLKAVLVMIVSLMGLIYAAQNVANLEQAYGAFAYVASNADHAAYPASFGPAFTSPVLIWTMTALVILAEFGVGFLAAKGALDLWSARQAPAPDFKAAKKFALLGCGLAIIVWFGFFVVLGGGYFQMWQTEVGQGSFLDAAHFAELAGVVLLFVNMADD